MSRRLFLLPLALVAAAVIAGCGGSHSYRLSPTPSAAPPGPGTATIKTAENGALGTYLVDGRGKAVYLFEKDRSAQSKCYGACAAAWPPVTTSGTPKGFDGVLVSRLSTVRRKDGALQVTYAGRPLYYFVSDSPGTTHGQGIDGFGAEWYVLAPSGKKVESAES